MAEEKKQRRGCKIFLISILVISLLFVGTILFLIFSYQSWQEDFEANIPANEFVTEAGGDILEEKISKVAYSEEETAVLELSPEEVASILVGSFQGNEAIQIVGVYIEPIEKGRWKIYIKARILDKKHIWVAGTIRKENRETAEIFLEDLFVGKYSLRGFGGGKLIEKINESITSALVTTEENGFLGRMLENIELLETGLVVKMEQY